MNKLTKVKKYLDKKLKKDFTGYPVGAIAFLGQAVMSHDYFVSLGKVLLLLCYVL